MPGLWWREAAHSGMPEPAMPRRTRTSSPASQADRGIQPSDLRKAHHLTYSARFPPRSDPSGRSGPRERHTHIVQNCRSGAYVIDGQRLDIFSACSLPPTPLFFAIAAVQHAAPLSSVRLARVDEVDRAIGRSALSDSTVVGSDEQAFDCDRTGVQWNFR